MKLGFSAADEDFRRECADWLNGQMAGEFKDIKGITTLTEKAERRKEWEQQLAAHGVFRDSDVSCAPSYRGSNAIGIVVCDFNQPQ